MLRIPLRDEHRYERDVFILCFIDFLANTKFALYTASTPIYTGSKTIPHVFSPLFVFGAVLLLIFFLSLLALVCLCPPVYIVHETILFIEGTHTSAIY